MLINAHNTQDKTFIIAEVGNNHEGSLDLAIDLIGLAAKAGANAVKFQTIDPTQLVSQTQHDRIKQLSRLCLKPEAFAVLAEAAKKEDIEFLSTPFDLQAVDALNPYVQAYKIASGDNDFYPLIRRIAQMRKPILLSTGMLDIKGIQKAMSEIEAEWPDIDWSRDFCALHCVAKYPVEAAEAQLGAIEDMRQLSTTIGYSDHTLGIDACIAAVAMGAQVIEKHFTIRNDYSEFRDHQLSANPDDMRMMINRIRDLEIMIGSRKKQVGTAEQASVAALRRSIVAKKDLPVGTRINADHLTWVRPMQGLRPGQEQTLIGGILNQALQSGETVTLDMVTK
jgi:N,N'-diacetyllegionaminate synthase